MARYYVRDDRADYFPGKDNDTYLKPYETYDEGLAHLTPAKFAKLQKLIAQATEQADYVEHNAQEGGLDEGFRQKIKLLPLDEPSSIPDENMEEMSLDNGQTPIEGDTVTRLTKLGNQYRIRRAAIEAAMELAKDSH